MSNDYRCLILKVSYRPNPNSVQVKIYACVTRNKLVCDVIFYRSLSFKNSYIFIIQTELVFLFFLRAHYCDWHSLKPCYPFLCNSRKFLCQWPWCVKWLARWGILSCRTTVRAGHTYCSDSESKPCDPSVVFFHLIIYPINQKWMLWKDLRDELGSNERPPRPSDWETRTLIHAADWWRWVNYYL